MAKVTGLGGLLYKVADPQATVAWYQEYLGIERRWGAMFPFSEDPDGYSVIEPFPNTTPYFDPSTDPFMVDFRVDDLKGMVAQLEAKGIEILGQKAEADGLFAWIMDCDGIKIELWQQIGPPPPSGTRSRSQAAGCEGAQSE